MLIHLISLVLLLLFSIFTKPIFSNEIILPKEKPSVFKKIERNINKNTQIVPSKKPTISEKNQEEKKIDKTIQKKENVKLVEKKIKNTNLILPQKKPETYRKTKTVKKSNYLSQKDFEKAKIVFEHIKNKKWITAYKSSTRMKDKDFKNFIQWLYLLKTGNNASFNDYTTFVQKNTYYPRIGRLQYLAEQKINLKNSTPNIIINWFENYPPVSGTGKLKLAEALLKKRANSDVNKLIKEGWVTADLSRSQLRYYKNKFKKILSSDDHIKRAEYLSWERKYWDLKRLLVYLPKDYKALYNAGNLKKAVEETKKRWDGSA